MVGRVRAFVVRDFQLAVSYRLEFFMRIMSILFVTTTLYFISRIFTGRFDTPYDQWRDPFLAWWASPASPTPSAPSSRRGRSKAS